MTPEEADKMWIRNIGIVWIIIGIIFIVEFFSHFRIEDLFISIGMIFVGFIFFGMADAL